MDLTNKLLILKLLIKTSILRLKIFLMTLSFRWKNFFAEINEDLYSFDYIMQEKYSQDRHSSFLPTCEIWEMFPVFQLKNAKRVLLYSDYGSVLLWRHQKEGPFKVVSYIAKTEWKDFPKRFEFMNVACHRFNILCAAWNEDEIKMIIADARKMPRIML